MTDLELLEAAIKELKLQKRLIKKAVTHDPTLYRAWVSAVLPSLVSILTEAVQDEKHGWGASFPELGLARVVTGQL
jgi:hypothetical protein